MKDAYSVESNEKSIFRFIDIKLLLISFKIYGDTSGFLSVSPTKKIVYKCPNFIGKIRNELKQIENKLSDL